MLPSTKPSAMGVACDYASSVLLCAEDDSSILGIDQDVEMSGHGSFSEGISEQKIGFFPLQADECLNALLEKEHEHIPAGDYACRLMGGALDISARNEAIDWIQKAHAYYSFGHLSAYLSINYLDRFLSAHELPQNKKWMMQLLAVTCLSLAIKIDETETPLSMDLQIGNAKFVFEAKTILRMELLVLSSLNWRVQPVTPFSFIDYFLHMFNNGDLLKKQDIYRCIDLILGTVKGIGFIEFKPSEVAAAVSLAVLIGSESVDMGTVLNRCSFLAKERVMQCYKLLQGTLVMKERHATVPLVPHSPIGVLDAATLSYNSDETISSSQENLQNNSPASKKRKLSSTLS